MPSLQADTPQGLMLAAHRLPAEVLGEVFSHCDRSSLVSVCATSFTCLALASAFLCEDITLHDPLSVGVLLRAQSTTPSSRITQYTARSLVHSLTYTGPPRYKTDFDHLSKTRHLWAPLRLAVLVLSTPIQIKPSRQYESRNYEAQMAAFMALFDPVVFIALGPPSSEAAGSLDPESWALLSLWTDNPSPWPRLDTILLSGLRLEDCENLPAPIRSGNPRKAPICIVVDLLDDRLEPETAEVQLIRLSCGFNDVNGMIFVSGRWKDRDIGKVEICAWVSSELVKVALAKGLIDDGGDYAPWLAGTKTDMEVVGQRQRAFRDELVRGGARRKADWGALARSRERVEQS